VAIFGQAIGTVLLDWISPTKTQSISSSKQFGRGKSVGSDLFGG
jgi:hypothetical protein